MGIRNLLRWTQWVSSTCQPDWKGLRGCRVGVDALSILYKARTEGRHMLGVLRDIIEALRVMEIEPVFVFDGKSPREKDGTRSARRRQKYQEDVTAATATPSVPISPTRVSTDDRNVVKQFFYAMGVLAVNAEHEADGLLAFLCRRGDLAAVITSDMDFLPRGVPWVILPNFAAPMAEWQAVHLPKILADARMTYDQFLEMCVLMGCDYAPSIPTISYQSAYWLIRGGRSLLEILVGEGIRTATAWISAIAILKGEGDRWADLLSVQQRQKWAAGAPPAEPDADILKQVPPLTTAETH